MSEVVWLKRDLRVRDHEPLVRASEAVGESGGAVVCLFIYESEWLAATETDGSHVRFVSECLAELEGELVRRGGRLVTRVGTAVTVLEELQREVGFTRIWSHEETGSGWTYRRDVDVGKWCRARGVEWCEIPQHGVVRRLRSRNGWSAQWERRMHTRPLAPPERVRDGKWLRTAGVLWERDLGVEVSRKDCQRGGETEAWRTLATFLAERGVDYRKGMSSPLTGGDACSRLSPYLAWGCISMREAVLATEARVLTLRGDREAGREVDSRWFGALKSFGARLRWHCHFMQKLEDEPRLEFENLHRGYDGLRDEMTASEEGRNRLALWSEGRTGYPMVDACMRSCLATGWLNFRMRAMVASFAAYHLWLHWRPTALFLARHFLDFEAGIHFPQFQMQSGTTGINTLRIYSPAKQMRDQDPEGVFVRRWVPELEGVPLEYLAEPHLMTESVQRRSGCWIGTDYPRPVVEHSVAYREARARLAVIRRAAEVREEARAVYERHGSRKQPVRPEFAQRKGKSRQMELGLASDA
ncbi:MAG: hypothetical protein RIS92_2973 [Verrucomicrobiota bacterium]